MDTAATGYFIKYWETSFIDKSHNHIFSSGNFQGSLMPKLQVKFIFPLITHNNLLTHSCFRNQCRVKEICSPRFLTIWSTNNVPTNNTSINNAWFLWRLHGISETLEKMCEQNLDRYLRIIAPLTIKGLNLDCSFQHPGCKHAKAYVHWQDENEKKWSKNNLFSLSERWGQLDTKLD